VPQGDEEGAHGESKGIDGPVMSRDGEGKLSETLDKHGKGGRRDGKRSTLVSSYTKLPGPGGGGGGDAHGGVRGSSSSVKADAKPDSKGAPVVSDAAADGELEEKHITKSGDIQLVMGWDDTVATSTRQRVVESRVLCMAGAWLSLGVM
jgi:hypothetical protein